MLRYIEGPEARFTARDRVTVDVEFFDGTKLGGLEPHRLFPVSGLGKYIGLMDDEGEVACVVRDINGLSEESKAVLVGCLNEAYLIPKIKRFVKISEKYGVIKWSVETDHGDITFEIQDVLHSVTRLYDNRVLIKDASDNRYEIPDVTKLDKRSLKMIMPNI